MILERLNLQENEALTLDTVFYYLDCMNKCISLFNKGFLNEYLPELLKAV